MPIVFGVTVLAAVAGWLLRSRNAEGSARCFGIGLAGLVLSVALFGIDFLSSGRSGRVDRYSAVVAYALGHSVAQECSQKTGVVYLVFPKPERSNTEVLDTAFNTIGRVLAPFPGLQVKELDVQGYSYSGGSSSKLPDFKEMDDLLNTTTGAVAIVSLVGLPAQAEKLRALSVSNAPGFHVFSPVKGDHLAKVAENPAVKALYVPRSGRPPKAELKGPPEELFQILFESVALPAR